MISSEEIRELLLDVESFRVERTISITNTDKFGQAICAFSNDLPDSQLPGYLIIGANDDGSLSGLTITDEILLNIAGIRADGNIQPQPAMNVSKFSFPEGDLLVAEVQPSKFPPVRFKGRIWIRIGPRKAFANEAEEKILYEKRIANITTFDAMPCTNATVDDLDTKIFKTEYLPKAFPEEILLHDNRNIKQQLQALGFFDLRFDCPTYAGIILFGYSPEQFLPGSYIQYVRFKGNDRSGEILKELKFGGSLMKELPKMDNFVGLSVASEKPIAVTSLREEKVTSYPLFATRELLMNAIMHRDYETNAPTRFYEFDNYIEFQNPGGLFGKARPENFPEVNDYRNPIIAEAMKVLGYVNRYNRGIIRVQKELRENGNGQAKFFLDLITAFKVIEPISEKVSFSEKRKTFKLTKRQLKVLRFCIMPKSREEILGSLNLSSQSYNYKRQILPLIEIGYLEYTKPEKPDIKGQQYILSEFGKELLNAQVES